MPYFGFFYLVFYLLLFVYLPDFFFFWHLHFKSWPNGRDCNEPVKLIRVLIGIHHTYVYLMHAHLIFALYSHVGTPYLHVAKIIAA